MSSNLYWHPIRVDKRPALPTGFKLMLRDKFGGVIDNLEVGQDFLPFLEGVMSASEKKSDNYVGAQMLYKAITVHGAVILHEQF